MTSGEMVGKTLVEQTIGPDTIGVEWGSGQLGEDSCVEELTGHSVNPVAMARIFVLNRRFRMSRKRVGLNRRQFLKTAVKTSACLAVPLVIPGTALGKNGSVAPSERIRLGAIGIGNRGRYVLGCFLQEPDLRCVAVCDVRGDNRQRAKDLVDDRNGNRDCTPYIDMRELLERDDIDAVLIATGPNWHATAATMAAKAGKDVYCEKPCTKNIAQSLALADVFRRTARVFQVGTQRRSLPNFA